MIVITTASSSVNAVQSTRLSATLSHSTNRVKRESTVVVTPVLMFVNG